MQLNLIQKKIVEAGVTNLREFGYPNVTAANIFTDSLYRGFFRPMLEENLGKGYDSDIKILIAACNEPIGKLKRLRPNKFKKKTYGTTPTK